MFNPNSELDPKFEKPIEPKDYPALPTPVANQSEECLVLDVLVPKRVFDDESVSPKSVLVWFHGGGFVYGSKAIGEDPAGLLRVAGEKGVDEDIIIVRIRI